MSDTPEYRAADLDGDGLICGLDFTAGSLAPIAEFDWGCNDPGPLDCWFDGTPSSDLDGTIVDWRWHIGTTTYAHGAIQNYSFPGPRAFPLTLTVTDDDGMTGEVTKFIEVPEPNLPPVADWTYSCDGFDCTFDASASYDPDGSIVDWAWKVGTRTYANGELIQRVFGNPVAVDLTLEVTDNGGLTDSMTQPFSVPWTG
jgi:hypothetical protein